MKSALILSFAASAAAVRAPKSAFLSKPVNDEAFIASVNSQTSSWVAGENARFAGMTFGDAQKLMGTRLDNREARKAKLGPSPAVSTTAPPATFDSRTAWPKCTNITGFIRDQSACGCCWAVATTEAFNDRMCIANNYNHLLSDGDTCTCSMSDGCDGGYLEDAWQYFVDTGVVTGGEYPETGTGSSCFPYPMPQCAHHEPNPALPNCPASEYPTPACPTSCDTTYPLKWSADKHKAKSTYGLDSVAAMQNDIVANGPISVAFTVYADFLTYKSGVYKHVTGQSMGGHAVKIFGWGTDATGGDYWAIANSWSPYWGNNGTFWIQRGVNSCGIESDAVAGLV